MAPKQKTPKIAAHYGDPALSYAESQDRIGANYIVSVGFCALALVSGIITLVLKR
jgi:hypothetical protein